MNKYKLEVFVTVVLTSFLLVLLYQVITYPTHPSQVRAKERLKVEQRDTASQTIIEARALNTPLKDCYTWQDIEVIIHGGVQE